MLDYITNLDKHVVAGMGANFMLHVYRSLEWNLGLDQLRRMNNLISVCDWDHMLIELSVPMSEFYIAGEWRYRDSNIELTSLLSDITPSK